MVEAFLFPFLTKISSESQLLKKSLILGLENIRDEYEQNISNFDSGGVNDMFKMNLQLFLLIRKVLVPQRTDVILSPNALELREQTDSSY